MSAPFLSINNALLQHQIIVHSNIADIAVKYLKLFLETTFLRNFILRRVNESLILYCSQEKETVPRRIGILCVSEGNQCFTVLKRTCALLFSGDGNWCSTDANTTLCRCILPIVKPPVILYKTMIVNFI